MIPNMSGVGARRTVSSQVTGPASAEAPMVPVVRQAWGGQRNTGTFILCHNSRPEDGFPARPSQAGTALPCLTNQNAGYSDAFAFFNKQ